MSRIYGRVLLGLGVFLVTLGALSRFYVYPALAVVPQGQDSVSTLVGPEANMFDAQTMSNITTTLTTKAHTVGDDAAAADAPDGTVVWKTSSSTRDSDGNIRSRSIERVAFDAVTGLAVDCCDTYSSEVEGEETPVTFKGLVYKFPFRTEKKDYTWWDSDAAKALPIRYVGVEDIEGVSTYKFVQTIDPVVTGVSEVPASILGLKQEGNVEAERTYSNVRTLWAEPRTGVVIKRTEQQYNTIRFKGEDLLVTTDVATGYDDATVKANADTYGSKSTQLFLLYDLIPLLGLILGLLCLVGGLLLRPWRERPRH